MRSRTLFLAAALLACAAGPLAASPDFPEGKWWKRPRVAEAVGLTEEQTRRIEEIFARARPTLIDRKGELEKKQGELEDSLSANAERREIAARVDAVEDARAELQKARILMMLDIKQVLKPEQWERLVRLHQAARRHRMERFGRRGPRTEPPRR